MAEDILDFETLSRDQVIVDNLSIHQNYVVTGGPGSGKTMLALMRVKRIVDACNAKGENPSILFIVFNRPLYQLLCEHADEVGISDNDISTYHTWLSNVYKKMVSGQKKAPKLPGEKWLHDWDRVKPDLIELYDNGKLQFDYILIDEAQIVPVELIEILHEISQNITVFMDKNQAVSDIGADAEEVVNIICEASGRRKFLQFNHRNSQAIVDLSMLFRDKNDEPEQATNKGGVKPIVREYSSQEEFAEDVADYAGDHPTETIGVLVDDWKIGRRYFDEIQEACGDDVVQKYVPMGPGYFSNVFDFDPGIKILPHRVMTGLEFDAVFIPETDSGFFDKTNSKRSMMLVAVTRARSHLVLGTGLKKGETVYPLGDILKRSELVTQS